MKNIAIVAKYKENIDWISNYNCEFVIYNKDEENLLPSNNYPNLGKESETYIRFILNNYFSLNTYDRILFLQGNPFDHLNFDQIEQVLPDKNGFVKLKSHLPIPLRFRWSYVYREYNLITENQNKILYKYETPSEPMKHWDMTVEFNSKLKLPNFDYLIQHTGAQWIVPPQFILNKSFEWWKNAHSLHFDNTELSKYAPYIFERLWENIWYHSDLEK